MKALLTNQGASSPSARWKPERQILCLQIQSSHPHSAAHAEVSNSPPTWPMVIGSSVAISPRPPAAKTTTLKGILLPPERWSGKSHHNDKGQTERYSAPDISLSPLSPRNNVANIQDNLRH